MEKTIISITREAASLAAITDLQGAVKAAMQADGTEAAKVQACAKVLAAQVSALVLPLASKVALIRATYADEFAQLAATKDLTKEQAKRKSNAVAGLIAALTCYCAADLPVETKAPADGKPAEFTKAAELPSLSAMRAAAATVKETAKASEAKAATIAALAAMTPEQKAMETAKAAEAAKTKAADVAAQAAAATKAANAETVAEFLQFLPGIMADADTRGALETGLLAHGLKLTKAKAEPKAGSMAEQLAGLTK